MSRLGRQRELSLVIVMLALGGFVFAQAPQFLSSSNLSQVAILAAIIAIAATGQALVVLTRNVDLSVDAMIGLVAFSVADILRLHALSVPLALVHKVIAFYLENQQECDAYIGEYEKDLVSQREAGPKTPSMAASSPPAPSRPEPPGPPPPPLVAACSSTPMPKQATASAPEAKTCEKAASP